MFNGQKCNGTSLCTLVNYDRQSLRQYIYFYTILVSLGGFSVSLIDTICLIKENQSNNSPASIPTSLCECL